MFKLIFIQLESTHWACHCHLVSSNGTHSIAVKFVTASNVYTSNGMTAFWQWLFDIAKSYISCHKVATLVIAGNCVVMWMLHCHSVAMKLLALVIAGSYVTMWMHHCHEVAGIDNCKQLCGNVDASLSFSCHELAGISHCRQLCGNVDASLPFSCHKVAGIGHC